MKESELLRLKPGGITILEEFLRNNMTPDCDTYEKRTSLDIIIKTKRFDLLSSVTIKNLLRRKTLNETYIEYILKLFKSNKDLTVSIFNPFSKNDSIFDIARLYIKYAECDMIDYLPPLSKENTSFPGKNKKLIEILLKLNSEITVNKIIPEYLKKDIDIAVFLNLHNIKQEKIRIDIPSKSLGDLYIEEYNRKYKEMYKKLSIQDQQLAYTLYELLYGTSSLEAINTVFNSYVEQLINNPQEARKEIEQLINIKRSDNNFSFIYGNESYYDSSRNVVFLSRNITSTVNHEIGHALFHNLTDCKIDDYFYDVVLSSIQSKQFLDSVSSFSKRYHEKVGEVKRFASLEYLNSNFNFEDKEELNKIQSFLAKEKSKLMKEYLKKGYKREILELLFQNSFTIQEYIEQHRKVQKSELKSAILRTEYDVYQAVSDMIDAVTKGYFSSGKLKDSNGEKIKACPGHGLYYFNVNDIFIFDEIIANYSLIIKSKNKELGLSLIKECLGEKFLEFLQSFYHKMLLSNEYQYKQEQSFVSY